MTGYLYRLILEIEIQAESQKDADEIAASLRDDEAVRIYPKGIELWSNWIEYMGIDTEVSE